MTNTATVGVPPGLGVGDPYPANNSATDTEVLAGVDYFTLAPCRVVDTRGGAPIVGPVMQGQETRAFAVAGKCGIPSTAKAISINVAVTQPTAAGNVRLFPAGQAVPSPASTTRRGRPGPTTPWSPGGGLAAVAGQPTGTTVHLIIDVSGYFQ